MSSWLERLTSRPLCRSAAKGPSPGRRLFLRSGARVALVSFLGGNLAVSVSGCGFRPVYGSLAGGGADQVLAEIDVTIIPERTGQLLRADLIRILNPTGRPQQPRYRLAVSIRESIANLAVQDARSGTRRNLTLIADYRLTRIADGTVETEGRIRTITSFNEQRDEFATVSAERDARSRALSQTAQDIRINLATHFVGDNDRGGD